ncbi:endonuclease/exonuclease/phosphatase family protein [Egicoccus sp. AB-alg2]|uniref:endonuclease/exonuclease/phosphatase family protein n=1 Tax=Egicoccus sp. AB-alg2 TaxID=3242693 RepID=UPI00359EE146
MIRVVAYNVSGGLDLGAAATVLRDLDPRIVCVLEAPGAARLKRLAGSAGLRVAARSGRRGAGTAVLVHADVRVSSTAGVPLRTPRDVPRREATHVIARIGGLRLSVTAVQLGLRPEYRRANLEQLQTFLDTVDAPSIVGCDLNESTRSPVAAALAERFLDAHAVAGTGGGETYPTVDPSTRQDFVFVDRSLRVLGSFVPTQHPVAIASHHRPVVADVAGFADDATRLPLEDRGLRPQPPSVRPGDDPAAGPAATGPAAPDHQPRRRPA